MIIIPIPILIFLNTDIPIPILPIISLGPLFTYFNNSKISVQQQSQLFYQFHLQCQQILTIFIIRNCSSFLAVTTTFTISTSTALQSFKSCPSSQAFQTLIEMQLSYWHCHLQNTISLPVKTKGPFMTLSGILKPNNNLHFY